MADTEISNLPAAGALAGTEPVPIVQGGVTKKTTLQDIANLAPDGSLTVTDGSVTVSSTTGITFAGLPVVDLGGGSAGVGPPSGGAQWSTPVTLNYAALDALDVTPAVIKAAAGAGTLLAPVFFAATSVYGGGFTGSPVPAIYFVDKNGVKLSPTVSNGEVLAKLFALAEDGAVFFPPGATTTDFLQVIPPFLIGGGENVAIVVQSDVSFECKGAIATSQIATAGGGLGYAPGDTFDLDPSTGPQASGVVDTVGALGIVLTYHLTSFGIGYPVDPGFGTTATIGIGAGLTIEVLTIDSSANPISLQLSVLYGTMNV